MLKKLKTNGLLFALTFLYFTLSFVEIFAEFYKIPTVILATKPLLMPLLIAIYCHTSKKINVIYLVSLVALWIGNIVFITKSAEAVTIGTALFTFYRILIIFLVVKMTRLPGVIPILLGSLPFLFLNLFLMNITFEELGNSFYLFAVHSIFTTIFGGIALGNYMFHSNKANMYLLVSTMLYTFMQFLFIIRVFLLSLNIFQPLGMLLFISSQYLLYRFFILEEAKIVRNENITQVKGS